MPGTRLGSYEVVAAIGRGGMGAVYRARDTRLHRIVALKVLHDDGGTASRNEQLLHEARVAAALQHPRICVVHDIATQHSISYLVLEYLEGETLAARVARSPMTLDEVLTVAIEIAEALAAAHKGASSIAT